MSEFIAKPIIKDHFWVVTDGDKKIGNIVANNSGYGLHLNGGVVQFKNTNEIIKTAKIRFDHVKTNNTKAQLPYPEFPTPKKVYNSLFDVKHKLHLFTKTKKSKCYHAAGWFVVEHNNVPQVMFCPKYIFVQRYPFDGPYKTAEEAKARL